MLDSNTACMINTELMKDHSRKMNQFQNHSVMLGP